MGYILVSDVGTSGTTTSLVDTEKSTVVDSVIQEYDVFYPQPNWAEQDPKMWWRVVCENTQTLMKRHSPNDVDAIVFAAQMMGALPVTKEGTPLNNCMIWLDSRGASLAKEFFNVLSMKFIITHLPRVLRFLSITGGAPGPKDTLTKIMWVKRNRPEMYEQTHKFLDCKDWFVYKTTGEFLASRDCASVTWLMDTRKPNKLQWSPKIASMADVDLDKMPDLRNSTDVMGELTSEAASEMGLRAGIPVIGGTGDIGAAVAGSGAVAENDVHLYVGSSAWLIAPVRKRFLKIKYMMAGIVSPHPEIPYIFVAEQESAGACLKWIRDTVSRKHESYADLDAVAAQSTPGANDLHFMPWMYGERCPVEGHALRGGFINLSLNHQRNNVIRSVLEGVAFHTKWMYLGFEETLRKKNKAQIDQINFIGGGAMSDVWCQIYADILNVPIAQVADPLKSGALGAALIASYGIGQIKNFTEEVKEKVKIKRMFQPIEENIPEYEKKFQVFLRIYNQLKDLYSDLNYEEEG